MVDRYTRAVLTVIAAALLLHLLRPPVPTAHAADEVRCTVSGPLEVRLSDVRDAIEVKWAFGQPGSSSSSPLYVKSTQ